MKGLPEQRVSAAGGETRYTTETKSERLEPGLCLNQAMYMA